MKRHANWAGPRTRRFRWTRLRTQWGRYHYIVNGCGDTLQRRWKWEAQ